MARNLYRLYLYAVFIALFVFAVSATSLLLGTLFAFTPLRGIYASIPTQSDVVQSLVFAVVSWVISGALGGLHYWLIRRDIQQDPAAATSAIRSFFLNITEASGVLLAALLIGFFVLNNWSYNTPSDASGALGTALATLMMVLALELERRRTSVQKGAALVFQRLHFFGTQLILLSYLSAAFLSNIRPLVDTIFFQGQGNLAQCTNQASYCIRYNALSLVLTVIWFIICWLAYSLITRTDTSRNTRMVMHGLSLALGIGYILYGLRTAFELALLPAFGISVQLQNVVGYGANYDFFSPLLLGLLVGGIYHVLLRDMSLRNLISKQARLLIEWATAGVLLAGAFWWGIGYGLYSLLQTVSPTSNIPVSHDWATTIALVIVGLGYIPLDIYLSRRYKQDPANATGPRRGFVLILLGGGILALAIGGSIALYTWGTALLGSPISNWPNLAQRGLAGAIVGASLIGIYLRATLREHLISRSSQEASPPEPAPTSAVPSSIENVVDELLAGRINRDEAVKLLHALQTPPAHLPV